MRNLSRRSLAPLLITAGVVSLGSMALAQTATAPGQTYVLKDKFVPGDAWHYNMTTDMTGVVINEEQSMPLNQHMTMGMTDTVESVRPSDGAATLQVTMDSVQITMNGNPIDSSMAQKSMGSGYTVIMSPNGKVLSMTSLDGAGAAASPLANSANIQEMSQLSLLPNKPVAVGDIWRGTTMISTLAMQMYTKMTLGSVTQDPDGSQVAHIQSKYYAAGTTDQSPASLPVGMQMQMNGNGTTDFNITKGVMQHTTGIVNMTMSASPSQPTAGSEVKVAPITSHIGIHVDMSLASITHGNAITTPPADATPQAPAGQ